MDIGSAFTFMFDDEAWVKKLAVGGLMIFGGLLLAIVLVGFIPLILINGYMLQTLKNVRNGKPIPLPEWSNFGELFSKGLVVSIIVFIFLLPGLIFACLAASTNPGIVANLGLSAEVLDALLVVYLCFVCLELLLMFIGNILLPVALIRYAEDDKFSAAFQLREIFSFISKNIGDYIIIILLQYVASMIAVFGFMFCIIGIFFTFFWSILVNANLYGQLAREAKTS